MRRYHYSCAHRAEGIRRDGVIRPNDKALGVAWYTDLDYPYRDALGLTSDTLSCDRTEMMFIVEDDGERPLILPWLDVRWYIASRRLALELESAPGALPRHWFVAALDIPYIEERKLR